MGTTERGYVYPDSTSHNRLWEHFEALAASIDNDVSFFVDPFFVAWTTYSPTWTSTLTQPAIGNGTLIGRYKQIGQLVHIQIDFLAGSTTNFGSGNWMFSLPVGAIDGRTQTLAAVGNDASPINAAGGASIVTSAGVFRTYIGAANTGVSNTVPWTWANGDALHIGGTYEPA